MRRSTPDVLVLMIAGTICLLVLITAVVLGIGELVHPEADTSRAGSALISIVNVLLGLLAGYLAGRTRERRNDDRLDRE